MKITNEIFLIVQFRLFWSKTPAKSKSGLNKMVKIINKEIPIDQIEPDEHQPRKDLGIEGKDNRLMVSLKEIGLRSPIDVVEVGKNKYKIIDGHRRFACAKMLGWKTIMCQIHPENNEGEIKRVRFEIQNNIRDWKPLERSTEVDQIKKSLKFKTNKELGKYLHYPESLLSQSLSLQKTRDKYQKLMDEYELSETYQIEFISFVSKVRKIKNFTEEEIIRNILDRIKYQVIKSAKDFRKLSSVFLRAHANEKELIKYLKDPDMKVDELAEKTTRSGLVRDIESVKERVSTKLNEGGKLEPEVETALIELHDFLNKIKK